MDKSPTKTEGASGDTDGAPLAKEMPRFGSTATFGSMPMTFGASFGRPTSGGGFFNIAPSFGNTPSFPSFLKLSSEGTSAGAGGASASPIAESTLKVAPSLLSTTSLESSNAASSSSSSSASESATAGSSKAPASLDFFSSATTSITFNMPEFKWGNAAAAKTQNVTPVPSTLFGVNPEKPASAAQEKESDDEGDAAAETERPPSPTIAPTTTLTKPSEPILTGEENEVHVHQVKAKLYRLDKEDEKTFWKERGVGQVRINALRDKPKVSRIVMRMDGALKLILNSKIFPTMPVRMVGESSVALSAISDEGDGKPEMRNFLLKLQGRTEAELLLGAIEVRKQKAAEAEDEEEQASTRGVKRTTKEEEEEEEEEEEDEEEKKNNSRDSEKEKGEAAKDKGERRKSEEAPQKLRRRSGEKRDSNNKKEEKEEEPREGK